MVFAGVAGLQVLTSIAKIIPDPKALADDRLQLIDDVRLCVQYICITVWFVAGVTRRSILLLLYHLAVDNFLGIEIQVVLGEVPLPPLHKIGDVQREARLVIYFFLDGFEAQVVNIVISLVHFTQRFGV